MTRNSPAHTPASSSADGTTYPALPLPTAQAWPALISLCVGFFMILLDQTIVAVASPAIQFELRASYNSMVWVNAVYLLCFAVPLLVTGRLGDRYGPKNLYIAGMVIFTASSLACGLSGSAEWLIAARAVQGLGAALLTPQTMSVISRVFPPEKRGAALGVWGATAGLSTLAGPLLGGIITAQLSWQWIFFVNVPFGVISLLAVIRYVPRFRPVLKPVDLTSVALSMAGTTGVIFGIQQGYHLGWPWWNFALIAASVLLTVVFVRRQATLAESGRDPLLPLALFSRRSFAYGNAGIASMGFAVAGMMLPVMLYLQEVQGLDALRAGLVVMPMSAVSMVCAPLVGRLVDRVDPRPVAVLGFSIMAVGTALLVVAMRPEVDYRWLYLINAFLGLGHSGVWAPNSALTLRQLPHRWAGAGSGVYSTMRQVGSVTGAAVVGAVMQVGLAGDSGASHPTAFGMSLIPAVAVLGLGALASWLGGDQVEEPAPPSPDGAPGGSHPAHGVDPGSRCRVR